MKTFIIGFNYTDEFRMSGTHNMPTGSTIEIKPYNPTYWNDDV